MIFLKGAVPEVIFSDWEAVNAAPGPYDIAYMTILGLDAPERRKHAREILEAYHAALLDYPDPAIPIPPLESVQHDVHLLTIVLYYVSFVVDKHSLWSAQGNTDEDRGAWQRRVAESVMDLDADVVGGLLGADSNGVTCVEALQNKVRESL